MAQFRIYEPGGGFLAWRALDVVEEAATRLDTLQAIELAEGVEVRLRVAGPLLRGAALGLDILIQASLVAVTGFVLGLAGVVFGAMTTVGLMLLVWFFLSWWYAVLFEAGRRGATPGKRALGLRVVQVSGSPISLSQAVLRNFLRFADGMPFLGAGIAGLPTFGFGLAAMLASRRFQRLGDLAAGTLVIYERVPGEARPGPPPMGESIAPGVALRPDEVAALVAFRERLAGWSSERRRELAAHAAPLGGAEASAVERLSGMAKWLQERR